MNLSFSNIAWPSCKDKEMYEFLKEQDFTGLEIAPTRIFPDDPYTHLNTARAFANQLKQEYDLSISSMQSIWYGRNERIFGTHEERQTLIHYTKQAIDFAAAIGCDNLVFGCPKNRNQPDKTEIQIAYDFFGDIASYAIKNDTVIALEPNPPIYHTNFINDTASAFDFANKIKGLKVNIDLGTIIENNETLELVTEKLHLVNHIHISEPNLKKIEERKLHNDLSMILKNNHYCKFISVEMKNLDDIDTVKQTAKYVRRVFS